MAPTARLVWRDRAASPVLLEGAIPLTIGRDPANRLCLANEAGLSRHHAELRPAGEGRWLLCDLGSSNGTYVEGQRLNGCRPLAPGDHIRFGRRGPLLQFLVGDHPERVAPQPPPWVPPSSPPLVSPSSSGAAALEVSARQPTPGADRVAASRSPATRPPTPEPPAPAAGPPATPAAAPPVPFAAPLADPLGSARPTATPATPAPRPAPATARPPAPSGAGPLPASSSPAVLAGSITVAGRAIPLEQIRGVEVRSQARHPHLFSWWVPACLGGLLLLPFPLLFWPWQALALVVAILLGRRREHTLILTLRDGRAHRHVFADRPAAQAHAQGVRRALGQGPDPDR